jgi:uncharacterized membrane protein
VYSELIVVVIPRKESLDKAWRTLERSHGGQLFELIDIVLIRRDNQGKAAFQMRWQESDHSYNNHSRLAGAFAEAIFGNSSAEGRRQLAEAGLDPLFLQDVVQALKPDSSAYLIYVPRESLIDTRRYLEVLGRLRGDLYHTTFRPQVEEALLKQNQ